MVGYTDLPLDVAALIVAVGRCTQRGTGAVGAAANTAALCEVLFTLRPADLDLLLLAAAAELVRLHDAGTIRIMDVLILAKSDDGSVEAMELSDLPELGELERIEAQLAQTLAEEDVAHLAAATMTLPGPALAANVAASTPALLLPAPPGWLIACIAGSMGHLVMKAGKRDRGIPTWGQRGVGVTGANGLLDRVDALCFAAPIFFHSVRWYFGV